MPKRALVIEGGGMKAAYANGVLSAFEEIGLTKWDAVYGTSAGGALAALFAAGQARFAERTWDYAADRRILSFRRWARRKGPLLDHEAMLDIIYVNEHPLDVEAVRRYPSPVVVTASDVHSGEVVYHDLRQGDVIAWLKATGRLPMGAGPPVAVDGREFLDGGILDPIPVRRAVADGHTDVTVILNKPEGHRQKDNAVLAGIAARRYPRLRDSILHHYRIKSEAFDYCEAPPEGVTVRVVRPSEPPGLGRLSRDMKLIRRAIEMGHADGKAFAEGKKPEAAPKPQRARRQAGTAA